MKKETLNVSLIQANLIWENPKENRTHFENHFKHLPNDCDLVILPEMFTTGFTMNPAPIAETANGETVQWLTDWAKKLGAAICGSIVIKEGRNYYNRFLFVEPEGHTSSYDKKHTFNMAGEGEQYKAGDIPVIIDYLGWKIFPQICYDLRFPVFSRNTFGYDVIIYVANWPKTRTNAWDTLLKARAIENMSYSIGVNRVGKDGNDLEYTGHSAVYNVLGELDENINDIIDLDTITEEKLISTSLSKKHIQQFRKALPFLEDRDAFTLQ